MSRTALKAAISSRQRDIKICIRAGSLDILGGKYDRAVGSGVIAGVKLELTGSHSQPAAVTLPNYYHQPLHHSTLTSADLTFPASVRDLTGAGGHLESNTLL